MPSAQTEAHADATHALACGKMDWQPERLRTSGLTEAAQWVWGVEVVVPAPKLTFYCTFACAIRSFVLAGGLGCRTKAPQVTQQRANEASHGPHAKKPQGLRPQTASEMAVPGTLMRLWL